MTAPWPLNIDDPVRSVHFLKERDCPWPNPGNCPTEHQVKNTLIAYQRWLDHRKEHTVESPDELTEADLPADWTEEIRMAFWSASNAPSYGEAQRLTLAFAKLLDAHHGPPRKLKSLGKWDKLIKQAESFVDDPEAFISVYREAHEKGAPGEVIAVLDRIQETAGGKL